MVELLEKLAIDRPGYSFQRAAEALELEVDRVVGIRESEVAELLGHLAEAHRRAGNLHTARLLFIDSFQHWKRHGIAGRMCWCLWGIAGIQRTEGDYSGSYSSLLLSYKLARGSNEQRCAAWAYAETAEVLRIGGFHNKAMAAHEIALNEFERMKDMTGIAWAFSGMAQIRLLNGDLVGAEHAFTKAHAYSMAVDDLASAAWTLRGCAETAKARRDAEGTIHHALQGIELFNKKVYPIGLGYTYKTLAEGLLQAGYVSKALEAAEDARDWFSMTGEPRGVAYGLLTKAEVAAAAGFADDAVAALAEAQYLFGGLGLTVPPAFRPSDNLRRIVHSHAGIFQPWKRPRGGKLRT